MHDAGCACLIPGMKKIRNLHFSASGRHCYATWRRPERLKFGSLRKIYIYTYKFYNKNLYGYEPKGLDLHITRYEYGSS